MQKTCLLIYFILFSINISFSQDIKLGDISPAEIALKECSFDKDANAVILLHEANSYL